MSFLSRVFTPKIIIVTHNGSFHADDLFACATLSLWLEMHNKPFEIIRTRDHDVIKNADYVFDVGGVYDPEHNRYDHHQKEGAGVRSNGIPYASFGLAWKHFGLDLCKGETVVWEMLDAKIAAPIDAVDNGVDVVTPKFKDIFPFAAAQLFLMYSPTWKENENDIDRIFKEQVAKTCVVLKREIKVAKDDMEGRRIINDSYMKSSDKRVVELDISFPRYLVQGTLSALPEPIYVIYPGGKGTHFNVEAISKSPETLESRKLLPESWRGLSSEDPKLAQITEIPDVIFCHRSGFLVKAVSKESAHKLAQKGLLA